MVALHTSRPSKRGESDFFSKLETLLGDGAHLWAELNSHTLGSGNECDVLLADVEVGVFAIEVKAIIIDQIEEMGTQACTIAYPDGKQTKHPLDQARGGMNSLRNYLLKRAEGSKERHPLPFMSHCVAFPKISTTEFSEAFASSRQLMDQAAGFFIFRDDLDSSAALITKLRTIRAGRSSASQRQVDFLVDNLSVDAPVKRRPRSSTADAERARVAIQRIAAASTRVGSNVAPKIDLPRDRAFLGDDDPKVAIFQGAPGTGKTLELMSLALEHAKVGRRVLFTCYNLVLASYLEGLLAHEDIDDSLAAEIDVMPVGRLLKLVDHDGQVIAHSYDTVCVDEAQDFSARGFDGIRLVAKPDARWFLADGPGQELFGDAVAAPLLVRARERAAELGTLFKLQGSKRAANASLQIARSVRDLAPNGERLSAWYSRRAIQRRPAQQALALDVEAVPDPAELIDIRYWSDPPGKVECFQQVLADLLERLERERRPYDLAVLVSRTKREALNLETVRRALDLMGVPYLDQTIDANKSMVLPEKHVRLVSYSSARGIEASRVLLLDVGQAFWRPKNKSEAEVSRTMLYVALTRGRLGTTVLSAPVDRSAVYLQFLQASVDEYERLMNAEIGP
ncbi:nuclease-like protein [Nocardioides sp. J9]|uniref:NERD domain-containing protein n=1 Tax=Nocardioides sp. J9 TaxID=935844 RepID=UPI0011AAFD63|nr:DEAD/DEAH box helicase family protein [Nocardioides sp. J9]TWH03135.1 nuclease-like protein [Nocardioides sp. J9]